MFFFSFTEKLAWFYWDPPLNWFVVPWINRPLTFYGLIFVCGLMIGYFILKNLLKQKLLLSHHLSERDIASWSILVKNFQSPLGSSVIQAIYQKIDPKIGSSILHLQLMQEANQVQKEAMLKAFNEALNDKTLGLTRLRLEKLFHKGFWTAQEFAYFLTDRMTWFIILGMIVGARLGHVFFYDWPLYRDHLLEIVKIWKGGLASHGGTVGVLLGLFLYNRWVLKKFPEITPIGLLDMVTVPTGLVISFIRVGNFFNQEIFGPETTVPWAVVFGHPYDGSPALPRHPTQLYEAMAYMTIFLGMLLLWNTRSERLKPGMISGLFFFLVFSVRFVLEFLKQPMSQMIDESFLQMGQYLSVPFILLGLILYLKGPSLNNFFEQKKHSFI
jgi:phosphatidylglycerol---prolipoprotein diacylglyceryl transferase